MGSGGLFAGQTKRKAQVRLGQGQRADTDLESSTYALIWCLLDKGRDSCDEGRGRARKKEEVSKLMKGGRMKSQMVRKSQERAGVEVAHGATA